MNKLDVIITDYRNQSYNDAWIRELDESLKLIDVPFNIIYITDSQNYQFTSTNSIIRLYDDFGNVSRSKQIGLNSATAEYVMFLDNDDKLISGKINYLLNNEVIFPLFQDFKFRKMLNGVIFKRDLIHVYDLKFINVSYYEDFYIVYRLFEHKNMTCSDEPMYYYRSNSGGICNSLSPDEKVKELKRIKIFMNSIHGADKDKINHFIDLCIKHLKGNL